MIIGNVHVSYDKTKPEGHRLSGVCPVVLDGLYEDVVPKLAERLGQDYADEAEIDYELVSNVSFIDLDSDNFNYAYELVMKACDNHQFLQDLKGEFDKAFRADDRFRESVVSG